MNEKLVERAKEVSEKGWKKSKEKAIESVNKNLEKTKYGFIMSSDAGTSMSGNGAILLSCLSSLVESLNEEYPRELIMGAVKNGLDSKKDEKDEIDERLEYIRKKLEELMED